MNTMVEVRFLLLSGPPGVSSTSNTWTQLTLLMPADPFPPSQGGGTASGHPSRGAAKRNLTRSHVSRATPWMALPKKAGPADAGNHMETSRFWGENPSLSPLCRGKSSEKKRPPPPRRARTIARDRGSRSRTDSSGVFPLPEFALLSLNFLWNSDLAASKLSKEETLRRLWKLPPGRDRKKPHAEYDPRGPSKGGSCFGDECCRVGSASRLGLRSFSRRDSVSDCTQFSLDDVFKSLKIRESPPGFKTAGRKRFIRRSPRVLGGGGKEGEMGEVRGGAEGWEALRFLRSPPTGTRTSFAVGRPSPRGLGSSYLLPAPTGGWVAAGWFARRCCTAGKQARARKEEETLGIGLPGVPALPCAFPRCPYVPPLDLPFPHLLQELRPPPRVGARGPVLASMGEDVFCTRKHWRSCWACKFGHMWSSLSYSTPWPLLNLFPWRPKEFPAFRNFCNGMHNAAIFWGRNLCLYPSYSREGLGFCVRAQGTLWHFSLSLRTLLQVLGRAAC